MTAEERQEMRTFFRAIRHAMSCGRALDGELARKMDFLAGDPYLSPEYDAVWKSAVERAAQYMELTEECPCCLGGRLRGWK